MLTFGFMETLTILEKLEMDQVVTFRLSDDKKTLTVKEGCDRFYKTQLSKHEVEQLLNELNKIVALMG